MINTRFLALCMLASASALAQTPAPEDPVTPPTEPSPPQPVPQPTPPQPPQPPVVSVITPAPTAPSLIRPEGFSVGIGIGYRFPTTLSIPNAASVRLRLAGGTTLEPTLVLASSSQTIDVGMEQGGSASQVGIGTLARFPVVDRRRTQLELLASFQVDRLNQDPSDQNPDDQTTTTTVSLGYGVAVGLWITQNLQVSLSATNSLVTYNHVREEMGFEFVQVSSTTTFGVIFDPTVALMVHLYN